MRCAALQAADLRRFPSNRRLVTKNMSRYRPCPLTDIGTTYFNDDFSTATVQLGATGAIDANFNVINGTNVDVLGPSSDPTNQYGYLCANGVGNCIDMAGTGGDTMGVLQSSTLFGAGNYALTFDLSGSERGGPDSVTVTFGNFTDVVSLPSNSPGGDVTLPPRGECQLPDVHRRHARQRLAAPQLGFLDFRNPRAFQPPAPRYRPPGDRLHDASSPRSLITRFLTSTKAASGRPLCCPQPNPFPFRSHPLQSVIGPTFACAQVS
jgi:hypothetical protein